MVTTLALALGERPGCPLMEDYRPVNLDPDNEAHQLHGGRLGLGFEKNPSVRAFLNCTYIF
jgi:hypothetical protein